MYQIFCTSFELIEDEIELNQSYIVVLKCIATVRNYFQEYVHKTWLVQKLVAANQMSEMLTQ